LGVPAELGTFDPDEEKCRPLSRAENHERFRRDRELSVSCDRLLLCAGVAVELAEQSIPVFRGPVAQLLDEVLNLLATGISESLGTAEVNGIGLYEFSVEFVLSDNLAKSVPDLGAGAIAVRVVRRTFL
jgi:hypothetical protein